MLAEGSKEMAENSRAQLTEFAHNHLFDELRYRKVQYGTDATWRLCASRTHDFVCEVLEELTEGHRVGELLCVYGQCSGARAQGSRCGAGRDDSGVDRQTVQERHTRDEDVAQ